MARVYYIDNKGPFQKSTQSDVKLCEDALYCIYICSNPRKGPFNELNAPVHRFYEWSDVTFCPKSVFKPKQQDGWG